MNGVVSLIMLCFQAWKWDYLMALNCISKIKNKNKKKYQDAPKQHVNISFCHQAVPGQASLCRISQISFCIWGNSIGYHVLHHCIKLMLLYVHAVSCASLAFTLWSHCWDDWLCHCPGKWADRVSRSPRLQSCAPRRPDSAALCGKGAPRCRPRGSRREHSW